MSLSPDLQERLTKASALSQEAQGHSKARREQEALQCYRQAMELMPSLISSKLKRSLYIDYIRSYGTIACRQSCLARALGLTDEAINSAIIALRCDRQEVAHWQALLDALHYVELTQFSDELYEWLLTAINDIRLDPQQAALASYTLLTHAPFWQLLADATIPFSHKLHDCLDPLLLALLRQTLVPSLAFERTMRQLRHAALKAYRAKEPLQEALPFIEALACHCHYNEWLWPPSLEEAAWLDSWRSSSSPLDPMALLLLCCYEMAPQKLLGPLESLSPQLWRLYQLEPMQESLLIEQLVSWSEMSDPVSIRVRSQYESYPYPRWLRARHSVAKPLDQYLADKGIVVETSKLRPVEELLVAGCGTGKQLVLTGRSLLYQRMTGIDLSYRSLGYAQRKVAEQHLRRVRLLQGDLLELEKLGETFDLIEAHGVLHHLEDPARGWAVLARCLKAGGTMAIGLYSELGRRDLASARKLMASMEGSLQARREKLLELTAKHNHLREACRSLDFFSTSTCKDLLLHEQESRFTLSQIRHLLATMQLQFLGFEESTGRAHKLFRERYGHEADTSDLSLWESLEEEHPDLFLAMYIFWVYKP